MDRSFQGIVFSLCLHALLVFILLRLQAPPIVSQNEPTEVTFIERKDDDKNGRFVIDPDMKEPEELVDKLKDQDAFLSAFTKRVKQQLLARKEGPNKNAQAKTPQPKGDPEGIAGERQRGQGETDFLAPGGGQNDRRLTYNMSSTDMIIPGVQQGSLTALNTNQFTYYAFYSRLNEQVGNRWRSGIRQYLSRLSQQDLERLARQNRTTVLEIIISPVGEFLGSLIHQSSGDRDLDEANVEAFKRAAPFPNPPEGMIEKDGRIHVHYALTVYFRPPSFGPSDM